MDGEHGTSRPSWASWGMAPSGDRDRRCPKVRSGTVVPPCATHAEPEVRAAVEADEENFLDRTRTRMFVVDTRESAA
uniref:Uncharacterized protein n=1 Tax=Streptomyces sp. NBC_01401 TaxID=2903854 RepID=A0AAU3H2K6_9ACTN